MQFIHHSKRQTRDELIIGFAYTCSVPWWHIYYNYFQVDEKGFSLIFKKNSLSIISRRSMHIIATQSVNPSGMPISNLYSSIGERSQLTDDILITIVPAGYNKLQIDIDR